MNDSLKAWKDRANAILSGRAIYTDSALSEALALIRSAPAPGREEIEDAVEGLVTELMQAVHVHYQADEDPDFGEYARDYTCAILALFHAPADPGGGEAEGAVRTAGAKLLTALERYGFPVSDAASTAAMSVEARDLHNAARRFKIAITSTKRAADEPAVTNGQ
jgi:hypothetical protein